MRPLPFQVLKYKRVEEGLRLSSTPYASEYRNSTYDFTAPSSPATFGLLASIVPVILTGQRSESSGTAPDIKVVKRDYEMPALIRSYRSGAKPRARARIAAAASLGWLVTRELCLFIQCESSPGKSPRSPAEHKAEGKGYRPLQPRWSFMNARSAEMLRPKR